MNVAEQHRQLRVAYKEAEDAIHSLGIEGSGVDLLAVNELRYAGYHLLKSLTASNDSQRDEELRRASGHCERALYEAHDAAIFYRLEQYRRFKEDYATVVVSKVIENYIDIVKTMRRTRQLLEDARKATTDRSQYYLDIRNVYAEIAEASETLEAARDELNKRLVRDQVQDRRWWVQVAVGFIGACLGAVAMLISRVLIGRPLPARWVRFPPTTLAPALSERPSRSRFCSMFRLPRS